MESNEKIAAIIENGQQEKMMCCQNGFTGPTGPTGATGSNGKDGLNGQNGMNGKDGLMGPTGVQGVEGNVGPTGMPGPQGEQGVAGKNGISGIQGSQGIKGIDGHNGIMGPTGPGGPQGIDGLDGIDVYLLGSYATEADLKTAHPTGNIGDAYLIGNVFYLWDDTNKKWINDGELTGPTGPAGKDGVHGNIGPTGEKGDSGLMGELGPTGPQGEIGDTGPTGPPGTAPASNFLVVRTDPDSTISGIPLFTNIVASNGNLAYLGGNKIDITLTKTHWYMVKIVITCDQPNTKINYQLRWFNNFKNSIVSNNLDGFNCAILYIYLNITTSGSLQISGNKLEHAQMTVSAFPIR